MDKYKVESEEIRLTAIGKFMNLKLEDDEDPDTAFFEADNLREMVKRHGVTISDREYKDAMIRVISNSYCDIKFAVRRDRFFSPEPIQSSMRNIYRAAERDERKGQHR